MRFRRRQAMDVKTYPVTHTEAEWRKLLTPAQFHIMREHGTGWPSFNDPEPGSVETTSDRSYGMVRTEVHCSRCGSHLGHVFPDGPPPTHLRYCINGVAMNFEPE